MVETPDKHKTNAVRDGLICVAGFLRCFNTATSLHSSECGSRVGFYNVGLAQEYAIKHSYSRIYIVDNYKYSALYAFLPN